MQRLRRVGRCRDRQGQGGARSRRLSRQLLAVRPGLRPRHAYFLLSRYVRLEKIVPRSRRVYVKNETLSVFVDGFESQQTGTVP